MLKANRTGGIVAAALTLALIMSMSSITVLEVEPTNAQSAANLPTQELKHVTNEHFPVPYAGAHHVIQMQLEKNDRVEGSFTISNFHSYPNFNYDGHGEPVTIKVEIMILDPNGQKVYDSYPATEGSFNFTGSQSGVYTFATGGYYLWLINKPIFPDLTLNYTVTGTPMEVNILSPLSQIYNSNVSLSFKVNRFSDWAGYYLDGNGKVTLWDANNSTPMSYGNTTLTELSNGVHTITVYANDTYGNMDSKTVTFTVDPSFASLGIDCLSMPTIVAIAAIIVAMILALSLILYRRHRRNR